MTDKIKSQTFLQVTAQKDMKDIFNQPNITLKARHGGLTIKFNGNKENGNDDNLTSEISKGEILDNFYENESLPTQIKTKEVATQTETSKEKSIDNVIKHTYSALTILEDKKINKIRKVIFNLKSQLKIAKEEENKLNEELSIIKDNLFELELIELKLLNDDFNRLKRSKIDEWRSDSELRTLFDLEAAIKKLTKEIIDQKIAKAKIINNLKVIALNIQKFETNIDKLQFQLAKNINKLNVPSLVLQNKINKRLALQKKFDEEDLNVKSKKNILKNIYILKNEIEKQWNIESNKVTRIYEEIINIGNNYCYITTFAHANCSITEKILYFSNDKNNKVTIQEQIKIYENINEYKNDFSLIAKILDNKKNVFFSEISIKELIKEHKDFNLKPTKAELKTWIIIIILTISIPVIIAVIPFAWPAAAVILIDKLAIGLFSITSGLIIKYCTSIFSTATKKVESWFYNKWFKSKERKEKDKKEFDAIIKNLTSDKIETKLATQYDILKQELDNSKYKKVNELISNETISKKENYLNFKQKINNNLNIDEINSLDLRNTQPSTSTGISNLL